jgi:hypothetical protein
LSWEDYHNFYLAFWTPFALGEAYCIFTKLRAGKYSADHTIIKTELMMTRDWQLIENLSAPTELATECVCVWIQTSFLWFFFLKFLLLFDVLGQKHVINSGIRWAYCNNI